MIEARNGVRENIVCCVLSVPVDQASEVRQSDSFSTLRFTLGPWGWAFIVQLLSTVVIISMIHGNYGVATLVSFYR